MDRTIYTICDTLGFDKQSTRTNIYMMQRKYCMVVEDLKDLLMDTYLKYCQWDIDPNKNKRNLFTWILENKIKDFYKKHNRKVLFTDLENDDEIFEDNIVEQMFEDDIIEKIFG